MISETTDPAGKLKEAVERVLSPQQGYFGWVSTWGQKGKKYEHLGLTLSEDIGPTIDAMTPEQRRALVAIVTYFETHARPLKRLLDENEADGLYKLYADIAWSHFAVVVMFGMLEVVVKGGRGLSLQSKGAKIKKFLDDNLSREIKNRVAENYQPDEVFTPRRPIKTFDDVVSHLWDEVRGGFVHDAGIEARGLEYYKLSGWGTEEDPVSFKRDVPMQEFLQMAWQAILNSYGYNGILEIASRG